MPTDIATKLRFEILERDDFRCQYCGRGAPEVELQIDHMHPKSQGGSNYEENLQTACADCNQGKRDKIVKLADPIDRAIEYHFRIDRKTFGAIEDFVRSNRSKRTKRSITSI